MQFLFYYQTQAEKYNVLCKKPWVGITGIFNGTAFRSVPGRRKGVNTMILEVEGALYELGRELSPQPLERKTRSNFFFLSRRV